MGHSKLGKHCPHMLPAEDTQTTTQCPSLLVTEASVSPLPWSWAWALSAHLGARDPVSLGQVNSASPSWGAHSAPWIPPLRL